MMPEDPCPRNSIKAFSTGASTLGTADSRARLQRLLVKVVKSTTRIGEVVIISSSEVARGMAQLQEEPAVAQASIRRKLS